ncbi:MAG: hypothetical protein ABJA61_00510 [Caldimonas sp.]
MKLLPGIVFAFATVASCGAFADQVSDQERRDRNREEALVKYRELQGHEADRASTGHETMRERTHETAQSVRGFTHRQAEKARRFSDRQNQRYGTHTKPNMNPEGGSAGGK